MASKYIQKFPIPEGFPEVLHDLSKEILRNQPADIMDFCAEYFKCLQEGIVLDYQNKGQNIPCDFKTGVPNISERPQRKKPLNDRDEALHASAVENSANIAKKPMTPDAKLMQADSVKSEKLSKHSATGSQMKEEEKLVINLKGDSKGYENQIAAEATEKLGEENNENKDNESVNKGNSIKEDESVKEKRENVGSAKGSLKSEKRAESVKSKAQSLHSVKQANENPDNPLQEDSSKSQEEQEPNKENNSKNQIGSEDLNNNKEEAAAENPSAEVPENHENNQVNDVEENQPVRIQMEEAINKPEIEVNEKPLQEGITKESASPEP